MASAHCDGGGCGDEAQQAGEAALLEGEVDGPGEVEERQQNRRQQLGETVTEALEEGAAVVHGTPRCHRGWDIRGGGGSKFSEPSTEAGRLSPCDGLRGNHEAIRRKSSDDESAMRLWCL